MRRREFVRFIAATAACWTTRAQAQAHKRVGVIVQGGPHYNYLAGLQEGLKAAGLDERTITLIIRETHSDPAASGPAAENLERAGVDVIVAFSSTVALAAKQSTVNVPIVFVAGGDPVALGLVQSMARPGGRLTGFHSLAIDLTAKRVGLLRELLPELRRAITFYDPRSAVAQAGVEEARAAARLLGIELIERHATSPEEVRVRAQALRAEKADAYLFLNDSMVISQDQLIVDTANALRLPTMGLELDIVSRGALVAYGLSWREVGIRAAEYLIRIIRGTPPSELPVERIGRPYMAINLKTARLLDLTIPPTLLARADEVIE